MEVLLLQDQDDVRERITFALESKFNAKVHEAKSVTRALEAVHAHKKIDFLIYDYLAGDPKIFQSLWAACASIPCIFFAQKAGASLSVPKEIRIIGEVPRGDMVAGVMKVIDGLVSSGEVGFERPDQGYCRIRTKLLLSVSPLGADIYIKLSDTHFVKLFQQGDAFDRADLEKYTTQKGVEYLFLKHENTPAFVDKYRTELEALLKAPATPFEKIAATSNELHETAQSLIASLGFTPQVQELARTQTELTKKALGRSPRLSELWQKLQAAKGKYLHLHSTLCSFYSSAIASKLEWASDTTYQKLALASFLHDITLSNNDLARIGSLKELEASKSKFTEREIREYKFHPAQSCEVARQMAQVLPDVDTILLQHHEWPDGGGFPRGLSASYIHPLASVFIVAHDLVNRQLEHSHGLQEYVAANGARFQGSHFKKILKAIDTP
jgi:HD-GYP domain-containing protein (c-di-GMP phosphodiesterase class II)